ncbi:response regulator [Flavisolibacter ginsengisoli]|jgi:DNA-binding NarL/FixJ family response regulator|uniref:Two component transcriptional regulator, LuxR family n=1 Tax=Flavisolibacter ginsengisoli DSM 18119 TaxID=1121884 RepID=A0A1M4Z5P6_9BACT|nr:response regulator transcription factor [Flavisolibacter ginsengisoli]SHF13379.1 two component transcriptional regulator, LuxR family [Flavisolibacter ginsengisoli DSM 18119]
MTTIIIFEDDDQLRDSLVALIGNSNSNDYTVIGNYSNAMDAATIVRRYKPDVVIMDIHMPGKTGIEAVSEIKEARPQTFIIMYTMFENDESLFSSLCAGANGYILKKTSPFKLFEAINEVMEGGAPMSPSIAKRVLQSFEVKSSRHEYHLTPREKEILQLLVKGYSIKIIADELNISFDTARTHLKNIYPKLHVNCGKEAIAKVLRERII